MARVSLYPRPLGSWASSGSRPRDSPSWPSLPRPTVVGTPTPLPEPPVHLAVVALADRDDAQKAIAHIEDDAVLPHSHAGILVALQAFGVRRLRVGHQHDDLARHLPVLLGRQRVEKAHRCPRQAKR